MPWQTCTHMQLWPHSSQVPQSTARSRCWFLAQHSSPCLLSDRLTWPFPSRVNGSADFGQDMITNCFPDLGISSVCLIQRQLHFLPAHPSTTLRTPSSMLAGLTIFRALFFCKPSARKAPLPLQRCPRELCGSTEWQLSSQLECCTADSYRWTTAVEVLQPRLAQICLCFHLYFYLTVPVQATGIIHHHWCVCERELSHPLGEGERDTGKELIHHWDRGERSLTTLPWRGRHSIDRLIDWFTALEK